MGIQTETEQRIKRKKKELNALRPFNKGALLKLQESFRVSITYNSNAIEGNTLSLSETKLVVQEGLTVGGKSMKEHLEAVNHAHAIDFVSSLVEKPHIQEMDVLNLHALILDRIDPQNAGFYRRTAVRITGTDYSPPNAQKIPEQMKEVYRLLNTKTEQPIQTASEVHQRFVDIHPFIDGNGRTARLLLNLYLMRNNYPPAIILKTERKKYISTIIRSRAEADASIFANFLARAVERSLDIYLDALGETHKEYLNVSEVAKKSKNGYSQEYLSLLARMGKIDAVKFGRNWKITQEALKDYERDHPR
jgi:Fic family protein